MSWGKIFLSGPWGAIEMWLNGCEIAQCVPVQNKRSRAPMKIVLNSTPMERIGFQHFGTISRIL